MSARSPAGDKSDRDAGSGCVPHDIVAFWQHAGPERWFTKNEAFDTELRARFGHAHRFAATGRFTLATPNDALACVLLLDQVPRNIYRGTSYAYATDALAREAASHALERQFDRSIEPGLRQFFYIPFQHSEDRRDQARSLRLFAAYHREHPSNSWLRHARHHARLIQRFGRFPHRNPMLGRETTSDEQDYLNNGGFAG
jgi:uncharacterized protein (DUF924 family)